MKKIIFFLIIILSVQVFSQDEFAGELKFENWSTSTRICIFRIYPVSIVFNGDNSCKLLAIFQSTSGGSNPIFHYINGVSLREITPPPNSTYEKDVYFSVPAYPASGYQIAFNHDEGTGSGGSKGAVGFGIYKVVVEWNGNPGGFDTCLIEWDKNYNEPPTQSDLTINFRDDNNGIGGSGPRLTYQWTGCRELNINSINKKILAWNQCSGQERRKNTGPFFYDDASQKFPQDSRRDCIAIGSYPEQNQDFDHNLSGRISLYMRITTDVTTASTSQLQNFTNRITILPAGANPILEPNGILEIWQEKILTLNSYNNWTNAVTLTVKGAEIIDNAGELRLRYGSELRVKPFSTLHLEKKSLVNFINTTGQANPKITLENGSQLCNEGAYFTGQGDLIINRGVAYCILTPSNDYIFKDSASLVLNDSAVFVIPDSSTVTFEGSTTKLILKPNSQIKFGYNSKLILKNGARLIANNATFTSLSSGQLWDGIYLEDVAQDSILCCIIENASNGITIRNRYSTTPASYSAEISGCTFSNNTTTQLNNGLYASNSTNILFRNNDFSSSQLLNGFSRGVVMEYCLGGSLLIIDNVITNSETGVSILQSSPYIARNSITGQQDVGYGINLDNSNGTVEYNIVNNFQYSLYGLYSSPYLLKNTLSNASIRNIELNSSSIPVMRPLASGSTLYWLGGDNRLEGSPSNGGVGFSTEAFPEMDSGWNSITLSSGSNYMEGTIPPMLGGTFYATLNYWGEDPPNPEKFIIYDGTIDYDPWTGGDPPPAADGFILNDIGFGHYDTVFTKSLGQSPSEDLFIQAYNKERTRQYNEAITIYKQVITLYRMSTYAPLSLSRIFNCAEKKRSTNGEYIIFESYFRLINTNNIHTRQLRELAEDYVIRAKVRQGRLNDAIADYTQMYQQNLNTPKGQHALANKQSLERIRDNSYGQQSAYSFMFFQPDNNQTISNTPKEFRLYQNYPNPFNPVTAIRYDLPADGMVKLVIYDITGKEVYSSEEFRTAGTYQYTFDGSGYASGLYFYKMESGLLSETKKMILIK